MCCRIIVQRLGKVVSNIALPLYYPEPGPSSQLQWLVGENQAFSILSLLICLLHLTAPLEDGSRNHYCDGVSVSLTQEAMSLTTACGHIAPTYLLGLSCELPVVRRLQVLMSCLVFSPFAVNDGRQGPNMEAMKR